MAGSIFALYLKDDSLKRFWKNILVATKENFRGKLLKVTLQQYNLQSKLHEASTRLVFNIGKKRFFYESVLRAWGLTKV